MNSRFNAITEIDIDQYYEEYNDILIGKCLKYNAGKNI